MKVLKLFIVTLGLVLLTWSIGSTFGIGVSVKGEMNCEFVLFKDVVSLTEVMIRKKDIYKIEWREEYKDTIMLVTALVGS